MSRLLAVLLIVSPVLATPPPEELAEEIAELREQIGGRLEVVADQEDFAEALRDVAQQAGHAEASDRNEAWGPGSGRRFGPSGPPNAWNPGPESPPLRDDWPRFAPPPSGPPRPALPPGPAGVEPRSEDPTILLRESAFDLEQIAHRLEMAELYGQADAVREAATHLRESARGDHEAEGRERDEARREMERERERVEDGRREVERGRREMEGMRRRLEEAARRFEERRRANERELREKKRHLEEAERRAKESRERRRKAPRDSRREAGERQGPPLGVHGGPTEPPRAEEE